MNALLNQFSDIQSWVNTLSLEVPPSECLSMVRSLLVCPINIVVARSLQKNEAQRLIDFLDGVGMFFSLSLNNL